MTKECQEHVLLVMVASKSDLPFLEEGTGFLEKQDIAFEIVVGSCHREPKKTERKIASRLKNGNLRVVIAGAATATGLPGFFAGHLLGTNIPIYGVRFILNPGQNIIEDATFNTSSMPSGVPLAYTGFNEKGFLHACMLAVRHIKACP